jgi:hypothetical protein
MKGIKQQIEETSTKEFEFGNLSVQILEEFIKDLKENVKENSNLNFEHQIFPMAEKDEI